MPPVGRRAAERNVFSFEGRLLAPPELVIDTSFVVDALITTQPRHDACRAFLDAIRDSGSVVYFNMLLVAELWEAAYAIKLRRRHGGSGGGTAKTGARFGLPKRFATLCTTRGGPRSRR
jgi:hypothetical protein